MSFGQWQEKIEEYKDTALYYANYHWINDFEADAVGSAHFTEFQQFLDSVSAPPVGDNGMDWAGEAMRSFHRQLDIADNANSSHLGQVDWGEVAINDQFTFCTLKPIMSLLNLLIDNYKVSFINEAKAVQAPLLAALKQGQQKPTDNIDNIDNIVAQFNQGMSLLLGKLVRKIHNAHAVQDKTSESSSPFSGTPYMQEELFEDAVLWITNPLELAKALMDEGNIPHSLFDELKTSSHFFNSPKRHAQIKNINGLHNNASSNAANLPLYESCIILSFTVQKTVHLNIVKPGMFNDGYPDLWAYSNSADGFGRTVRLNDGGEGAPEALVKLSDCMPYLTNQAESTYVTFVPVEQRVTNKPTVASIIKKRSAELGRISAENKK